MGFQSRSDTNCVDSVHLNFLFSALAAISYIVMRLIEGGMGMEINEK